MSAAIERRKRVSAGEVALRLAEHERDCAERYGSLMSELRAFRAETKPLLQVWEAGGVAVRLVKLIALVATAITAVWAAVKLWPRA